ncbi:MAG: hypothetical protein LLG14_19540 [Nocardiaceae bacterium]|nr:hypothetical protein [Nocardiaceae bacterium]
MTSAGFERPRAMPWWKSITSGRIAIAAAVAFVVLLVVAIADSHKPANDASAMSPTVTEQSDALTGTLQDWTNSVCVATFVWTDALPNAERSGVCQSSNHDAIFVGEYSSDFARNSELTFMPQLRYYASAQNADGQQIVLWAAIKDDLQPLTRFGFIILAVNER